MRFAAIRFLVILTLIALGASSVRAAALGTAFTYQGRVDRNNVAVSDTYSMIFRLYDAATAGSQVGTTQTVNGIVATNGLFNATIDFGPGIFTGQALWLDVQIKGSGDAGYTPMTSRQPITAVPYALFAVNGGTGSSQWISNGPDLTYSAGSVGVLGASSPFASGKGVFLEGGIPNYANVFAFNYDTFSPLALALNAPGGNVAVGTTTPGSKFDVVGASSGLGIRCTMSGSLLNTQNIAVLGVGNSGGGISGTGAIGVWGQSTDAEGVYGQSTNYIGVYGYSTNMDGTWGYSAGANKSGVVGISSAATGKGGYFRNDGGGIAMLVDGTAQVKTLQILGGADLAERFESADAAEPGTVMAIDPDSPGRVRVADGAYSHTVAGVVSGANGLAAGVEMGKDGTRAGTVALALTGRVWVRCDATLAPIHVGDLLTTADHAGYAMAVTDHDRAQGAIVGKAMTSLVRGTGLVLVLVSLQ